MAHRLSLARRTNQCGSGMRQQATSWRCGTAIRIRSHRSHFRLMVNRLSLAQRTNLYGSGILDLCTSARRYPIPVTIQNTLGGFSPLMANTVSCLCPPSCSFLMLPTSLLSRARLAPLLTLHIRPLAFDGSNVTILSIRFVYYLSLTLIIAVTI